MILKRFFNFLNEDIGIPEADLPEDTDVPMTGEVSSDKLIEIPTEEFDDYDRITLSKKFENRLKELKISQNPKIKPCDKVVLLDDKKGKLKD